jgi:hypothetical protein
VTLWVAVDPALVLLRGVEGVAEGALVLDDGPEGLRRVARSAQESTRHNGKTMPNRLRLAITTRSVDPLPRSV